MFFTDFPGNSNGLWWRKWGFTRVPKVPARVPSVPARVPRVPVRVPRVPARVPKVPQGYLGGPKLFFIDYPGNSNGPWWRPRGFERVPKVPARVPKVPGRVPKVPLGAIR